MSAAAEPIERRVTSQRAINLLRNNPIFVAIALLVIVTSVVEPKFLTAANFDNILRQFGTLIFAALGMTFVIMAGFLDLSIGGIISLVAVVTVTLIDKVGQGPAILIGISVGLLCGLINSALIITSGALTQAESLFITFGMSLVYGAVALMYVQGVTQFLTYSTTDISIFNAINSGGIGFLSVSAVLFLACLAVLYVIERRTYLGRAVVLTGGNKVAARLAGIPITRTIVFDLRGLGSDVSDRGRRPGVASHAGRPHHGNAVHDTSHPRGRRRRHGPDRGERKCPLDGRRDVAADPAEQLPEPPGRLVVHPVRAQRRDPDPGDLAGQGEARLGE